jgi:CRP/FNR family transcriptional regulator
MKQSFKTTCSNCNFGDLCMPNTFEVKDMHQLEKIVTHHKKVKKGESVFLSGDELSALYSISSGFFKVVITSEKGYEQIVSFKMSGEFMGLDGLDSDHYICNAIALEDSEVCVMPVSKFMNNSQESLLFQKYLNKNLSHALGDRNKLVVLLGHTSASRKLAIFLSDIFDKLRIRGQSSSECILRMSRDEIGSYLGLSHETITRELTKYSNNHILAIHNKHIKLLNPEKLFESTQES